MAVRASLADDILDTSKNFWVAAQSLEREIQNTRVDYF